MSQHAPKSPSAAPIWGNCSGALAASAGRIDESNERTRQGTAAHWVMEQCAKNWRSSELETDLHCADWVGQVDPDGTVVTDEIAEGAQYILDDMLKAVNLFGGYKYLLIEQRVAMPLIHKDNWGTLDLGLYNPAWNNGQGLLIIWDYKHGFGLVRAKDNLQLVDYTEGVYEAFALPTGTEVRHRIVQPFAYAQWGAVDEHVYTLQDLFPMFAQLSAKAHEADTNPQLTAGKHCRYCPGRVDCSAAREYLYLWGSVCDMPYQMDRMTLDDKAREIDLLHSVETLAKSRRTALEDTLRSEMSAGKLCNNKALESVPGRLNWNEGQKAGAIAAFKAIGVDADKHEPLTPTQVLQRVPKDQQDIAQNVIKAMATRKNSLKLVDRDDSLVARAFGAKQPGV